MGNTAKIILGLGVVIMMLGTLFSPPATYAAGRAPSSKVCKDKANPPKDPATQGGCVVINRKKGNCMGCHLIAGTTHGNIAPPLVNVKQRFPNKAKLRFLIWDASKLNKHTVMPPYGKHGILTEDEIDQVVEFLLTL